MIKYDVKAIYIFLLIETAVMLNSCDKAVEYDNLLDPKSSVPIPSPSNLQIVTLTDTSVTLKWEYGNDTLSTELIDSVIFIIEYSASNDNIYSTITAVRARTTVTIFPKIFTPNETHSFRLYAYFQNKKSMYSNIAAQALYLLAPSKLTIVSMTPEEVKLEWIDNSTIESGCIVEQSADGINFSQAKIVDRNETTTAVNGEFDTLTIYSFRMYTFTSINKSGYSNVVFQCPRICGTGSTEVEMIFVEGGTFQMGSTKGNADELPVHGVSLDNYYLGKYEITRTQWKDVIGWKNLHGGSQIENNSASYNFWDNNDDRPISSVTYDAVLMWIGYLNEKEGTNKYRLPTEAEWEYAARGGKKSLGYLYSGGDSLEILVNNFETLAFVKGMGAANELGFFDMSDNVYEMCSDWYGNYSSNFQNNPTGSANGTTKVVRGGSYIDNVYDKQACRVTARSKLGRIGLIDYDPTSWGSVIIGFRIAWKQ